MTGDSRFKALLPVAIAAILVSVALRAQTLEFAKDGSGARGYRDTPVQPWSGFRVHDADRPLPKRVEPGGFVASPPPSDAIVLFDGNNLSAFASNQWSIAEHCIVAGARELATKQKFGSCQVHLEWMTPTNFTSHLFDRGNNGVMLMGLFEIQIYDSFTEKLYADGEAGAVYGQTPPLVNACRPPGQWQSYDIVFIAPKFDGEKLVAPARVTVIHNGVVVQNNQEIYGETVHRELPRYKTKTTTGPLVLAGHNCPVRFRNIWLRPLP